MKSTVTASLVMLILLPAVGCVAPDGPTVSKSEPSAQFIELARLYREGQYDKVNLPELRPHFERRMGMMSASELRQLLGDPRVVARNDDYYRYALALVYSQNELSNPDIPPEGRHDEVWHYGEAGPSPWIADESSNLFFVIKNGIVVSVRELA